MRPPRQRVIITGAQYGHLIAHEATRDMKARIECECAWCHAIHEIKASTLIGVSEDAERSGYLRRCKACNRGGATAHESRLCSKCYGMSHRRPVIGACKCGERFAPEEMERPEPRTDCMLGTNTGIAAVQWI